jgi:hypothetical protein
VLINKSALLRDEITPPGRLSRALATMRALAAMARADQSGSQVTDNLGLIVIGIVAIVAIGGLISGLDTTVFNWVTGQLGLST